ncbi:type IV pilin [Haladaptatus cibarius]|uniref:type IV pilin n=1 Tax=Haladaptatus cibarius TaxID=453847 RepID=UPI000679642D|nr:type IV pilin [Haladaptatus cibarius]
MSNRALSPVVATVLLLLVTLVLAGTIGAVTVQSTSLQEPTYAVVDVSADAATNRLTFVHRAGDSLAVESLSVHVLVDGTPLKHQPPVPFFSAHGFQSGPTGPFNSATNETWDAGETASLGIAGTNAPLLETGDRVVVRIAVDDTVVTEVETTAE